MVLCLLWLSFDWYPLESAVGHYGVEPLIGGRTIEPAECGDVWAELDEIERCPIELCRPLFAPRIPTGFKVRPRRTYILGQLLNFVRGAVAAHQTDARYGRAVTLDDRVQRLRVEPCALILLQPRTVASGTGERASGYVDSQSELVGNLLSNYVVIEVFQHSISPFSLA